MPAAAPTPPPPPQEARKARPLQSPAGPPHQALAGQRGDRPMAPRVGYPRAPGEALNGTGGPQEFRHDRPRGGGRELPPGLVGPPAGALHQGSGKRNELAADRFQDGPRVGSDGRRGHGDLHDAFRPRRAAMEVVPQEGHLPDRLGTRPGAFRLDEDQPLHVIETEVGVDWVGEGPHRVPRRGGDPESLGQEPDGFAVKGLHGEYLHTLYSIYRYH